MVTDVDAYALVAKMNCVQRTEETKEYITLHILVVLTALVE
jgi:hypothetical protein